VELALAVGGEADERHGLGELERDGAAALEARDEP
jgi:hypothetical protein